MAPPIAATRRHPTALPPGGIRIWHASARNVTAVFEHHNRPYRRWNRVLQRFEDAPLHCAPCKRLHRVKTYHVSVDADGFAIVSREIWAFMSEHGTAGFQLSNEVAAPPEQRVAVGTLSLLRAVEEVS